ncbi:hypothetical protein [Streptomyces sp. NPDC001315]|uniref:hypothetical protein n=1 Tax=Streptomyces sp. NPDC001315 TaxID=3364562 RepID=UPI0036C6ABFF
MQDDGTIRAEEAGAWLRTRKPEISIRWDASEAADEDAYRRLLKLLFSPRAGSDAA